MIPLSMKRQRLKNVTDFDYSPVLIRTADTFIAMAVLPVVGARVSMSAEDALDRWRKSRSMTTKNDGKTIIGA